MGAVGEGLVEIGLRAGSDEGIVSPGGDAVNALVMAARLGAPTRLGGRVGADACGRRLLRFWRGEGIDLAHVVVDAGAPTGIYTNELTADGGHAFDYHRTGSAGSRLEPGDLTPAFASGLAALHTTGITLAVSAGSAAAAAGAVATARRAGALISFAVNHRPGLAPDLELLREQALGADIVFATREEVALLLGEGEPSGLLGACPEAEVVVSDGAAGALVLRRDARWEAAAPPVEAVDTAGAGDALAGAYLARRVAGDDPPAALRAAVRAASLSCRARGCSASYPRTDEVLA